MSLAAPCAVEPIIYSVNRSGDFLTHPRTGETLPAGEVGRVLAGETVEAAAAGFADRLPRRLNPAPRLHVPRPLPTVAGFALDTALGDDDDADRVMGALGYAWRVHGDPKRTGPFTERSVLWSDDGATFTVDVDMSGRLARTRTAEAALAAFLSDAAVFMLNGSPERKDGTRLFGPCGVGQSVVLWVA